jgi:hypothetical protein
MLPWKIYMRVKVAVPMSQDKEYWLAGMSQDKEYWLAGWYPDQSESFICDVVTGAVIPHAAAVTLWCCPVFRVMKHDIWNCHLIIPKCSD